MSLSTQGRGSVVGDLNVSKRKKIFFVVLRHVHPNGLEDAHVGIDPRCIPLVHPGSMNPIPTASIRLFEAYTVSRWYTPCR